jgi:hypothetical protein
LNKFLSRAQFAKELGISLSTLERRAKEGVYPFSAFTRLSVRRVVYDSALLNPENVVQFGLPLPLVGNIVWRRADAE